LESGEGRLKGRRSEHPKEQARDCLLRTGDANKQPSIIHRIPIALSALFLSCALLLSLCRRAEYCAYKHGDNPVWIPQDTLMLLATAGFLFCVLLGIYRLGARMNRLGRRYVTGNILYLSFAVQLLYIILLPADQFADQTAVNRIALELINGDFRAFQRGGYLYQYPNNIGITLMLSLVYRLFPRSMPVPKFLNAVFSTVTSYLVMRIYEESIPGRRGRSYGILLLSGFFLPMILLNNLVYNDIYATTLFSAAVYYAIRFSKSRRWLHLFWSGFCISLGNFLRQLGLIFLIAVVLFLVLKRAETLKILVLAGMTLVLFRLPMAWVNNWLLDKEQIKEPIGMNSVPIHMWIHMGMNEERFGYWDNSFSYNIYLREGGLNKEKSARIYSELIKKNLQGERLLKTVKVYVKKNFWLWTEGTYQAEYYGIGSWGYLYPTFASRFLENNTAVRDWVRWIMHAGNFLLLLLALYGLAADLREGKSYFMILPAIVFLGFVGFYTLWEIKPRYIYPACPYLILMSYYGLSRLVSRYFRNTRYSEDPVLSREEYLVCGEE